MKRFLSDTFFVKLSLVAVLLLACCSPIKQADKRANKNTVTAIYPETAFDEASAKNAIAYGTATIKGVVFTKEKNNLGIKPIIGAKTYGSQITVTLFPVTPYFEAWYSLRQKRENKKTVVYMANEAFKYRIDTKTDQYGRFTFEKMKAGRYFLQALMSVSFGYSAPVQVGTGYTSDGRTIDYYEQRTFNKNQHERLEKFVEVKTDGQVVEVSLK